jgi:putative ABC transport system permease protein
MTGLIIDLRSAFRLFLRNRGLSVVALTSLAVGIGVSVAITSVATAVLVRPLPYDKPEDLVMIWRQGVGPSPLAGFWDPWRTARGILTPGAVLDWREQELPFEDFAVVESWQTGWAPRVDLIEGANVERLRGTLATANLFDVLGVHAARGRTFSRDETGVAVISDRLWRRRFGADPGVVGKTITLATGRTREQHSLVEIIGVLPDRFRFDYPEETEIWLPLTWSEIASYPNFVLLYRAVARLRGDTPLQVAEAAMQAFRSQTDQKRGTRLWLEPVHDHAVGRSRQALLLVSALTLLVLLSGAINAATVFAASTVSRLRDMRVRRALGASQGRLVRQAFTETATVAVLAGVVGLGTVTVVMPGLRAILPAGLPRVDEIGVDWLTLCGVCGAVVVSTMLAGVIPAWLSVRDRDNRRLEDSHSTTTSLAGLRLRMGLLGVQFTLVTALLITGGMLVRSFWNVMHVDKGFEAGANVYVAEIQLMHPAYRDQGFSKFERELLRRVRDLRYVEAASLTSAIPLHGTETVRRLRRSDGQLTHANARNVDPAYFEVMRIPLLSGRWLTDADASQSEWVVLVSQSLAMALYPGENPLGKFLEGSSGARIVGVVADVRSLSLLERPMPALYAPRALQTTNQICLLARTGMGAAQVAADLRRIVREVYPGQPVQWFATLEQVLDDSVADRRAYAVISGAFAVVMLLLSGVGLCGHLSHVVAERARDLAIRSALGASSRQQRQLLVRHIVPALIGGVGIAMMAVYVLSPFVAPFLFEIDRLDLVSCGVSALLVTSFTAAAVLLPARRMSRLDAATMLRST